jgi:hypothetical protein
MEGFSSVAREVSKALPFGAPLFGAKDPLLCRLRHAILNATRRTARDRGLRRGSV